MVEKCFKYHFKNTSFVSRHVMTFWTLPRKNKKMLRVAYLFTSSRSQALECVRSGENHGAGFWGLSHLASFGVQAELLELEQTYPLWFCKIIRQCVSVYWLHLFIFWRFFSYDIVFTSTGFGTQLIFTLLRIRHPRWVMHDFNITGFLGDESTFKQKLFAFLVSRAAGIVTLSEKEAQMLKLRFPHLANYIAFVPFGADTSFFISTPVPEGRQILAVGTDPDRDYKTLFSACKGLDIPVIVTTYSSRLTSFDPLPPFVTVKKYSPHELVEAYNRATLVVIPLNTSLHVNDAMGCSAVHEALVMGKAIIATRTFTLESYIKSGENGLLIEEGNVSEMRQAIQVVMSDGALRTRLAKNARVYALEHLEINACTKKLADFFETLPKCV
jgi:glycosyltransferase involved in cell wall biosynthesis